MCLNRAISPVASLFAKKKKLISLQWNNIFLPNFTILSENVNKPQEDYSKNIQLNYF